MKDRTNWAAVARAWAVLEAELGPIDFAFSEVNAERVSQQIDALLAATTVAAPEPLYALLDALSNWLAEYESHAVSIPQATPAELLRHLMESNGLKQADLAPLLGGQPIVSAILNGKRRINARQAVELGRRFKLSAAAFLAAGEAEDAPALPVSAATDQLLEGIDLGQAFASGAAAVLPPIQWDQVASTESSSSQVVLH